MLIDDNNTNVDWDTLCAIYSDNIKDESLQEVVVGDGNESRRLLKGTLDISVHIQQNVAIIETKNGILKKKRHANPLLQYSILESQGYHHDSNMVIEAATTTPIVRLSFYYDNSKDSDNSEQDFDCDMDIDDYGMGDKQPVLVKVSSLHFPVHFLSFLSSITTTIATTTTICNEWIAWMNKEANKMLEEHSMGGASSAICQFMEYDAFHQYFFDVLWKNLSTHTAQEKSTSVTIVVSHHNDDDNASNNSSNIVHRRKYRHLHNNNNNVDDSSWVSIHDILTHPSLSSSSAGDLQKKNSENQNEKKKSTGHRQGQHQYRSNGVHNDSKKEKVNMNFHHAGADHLRTSQTSIIDSLVRTYITSHWKEWYTVACPICFDIIQLNKAVEITCHHFFCKECITSHVKATLQSDAFQITMKSGGGSQHATTTKNSSSNLFKCPLPGCKREMKIIQCVKPLVSQEEMEWIQLWYKNIKHPLSISLTMCPRKICGAKQCMRRMNNSMDCCIVYCEVCNVSWCEHCLQRCDDSTPNNGNNNNNNNLKKSTKRKGRISKYHTLDSCDSSTVLEFCYKYSLAKESVQQKCLQKWPWLQDYTRARVQDMEAMEWTRKFASTCPTCKAGIERIEGCFHMKCPLCFTHFCYECGDQIYPPYYGTHHCWEIDVDNEIAVGADRNNDGVLFDQFNE